MSLLDWTGHGAIVTGGASGLGAATAQKLAADGLRVTLFDLNAEAGAAHAHAIGGQFVQGDVSDPASVAAGLGAACPGQLRRYCACRQIRVARCTT